jgi:carbamoyl-phosphate synthase large subunit
MNVMLTCSGRRNYLVKAFQSALGDNGLVLAGDASVDATSIQEADRGFILPRVDSPEYFDRLLDICEEYQVKLLIPLNDLELPLLARQRDMFLKMGTIPLISAPETIDTCFDKWKSFLFFTNCGISVPKTYLSLADTRQAIANGDLKFPIVVKPRWGSASIGIEYAENDEELDLVYRYVRKKLRSSILATVSATSPENCILFQEKIIGKEYGLDTIADLEGNYITTFVKQKLSMRAGETDRARTVKYAPLEALGAKIARNLPHIGNLDCDAIVDDNGKVFAIEMNPRFGGGYPFSHAAGVNLPAALLAWASGTSPDPSWLNLEHNLTISKCARLVIHQQWE